VKCPFCASLETKVVDSRLNQTGDITRRRRECFKCGGRYTTYERVEEVMPVIIKKDGRRETFLREKIMSGLQKAAQKRPVTIPELEAIASRIEKRVQSFGLKEVPSKAIGQMVMVELHRLDKVAYVRFASVYRDFKDLEEFVADLQETSSAPEDEANLAFPFAATGEEAPETGSNA
jgi:transcriptional repressor NrdR